MTIRADGLRTCGGRRARLLTLLTHLVVIAAYIVLLKRFDAISAFGYSRPQALLIEAPLAILIYYAFFIVLKKGTLRYITAALPVLLFYGVFEIYYRAFGSMFKFVAVKQLPELLAVLDPLASTGIIGAIVVVVGFFLLSIDYRARRHMLVSALALVLVLVVVEVTPGAYLKLFEVAKFKVVPAPETKNVASNGRLAMAFYWEAKRVAAVKSLEDSLNNEKFRDYTARTLERLGASSPKANVHLIVLESFFDPSLFSEIKFSRSPIHPRLMELFQGRRGLSRAPVFGGRSAQAEFEVLCGVPAFAEFDDIEFNLFGGGKTACLPDLLAEAGYRTLVTNAYKPFVFNSDVAYRGLGFQEVNFPQEYAAGRDTYFVRGELEPNEDYMFDGELFRKNVDFVRSELDKDRTRPTFNYVLSLYGHYPFWIDYAQRPKVIDIEAPPLIDPIMLERLVNQMYYRTQAVAAYVEELLAVDPDSLIVVVGDHLPNLERMADLKYGHEAYRLLGYLDGTPDAYRYASVYAMWQGEPLDLGIIDHFNVYEIILDRITGGAHCQQEPCFEGRETYRQRYVSVMAQAVQQ